MSPPDAHRAQTVLALLLATRARSLGTTPAALADALRGRSVDVSVSRVERWLCGDETPPVRLARVLADLIALHGSDRQVFIAVHRAATKAECMDV